MCGVCYRQIRHTVADDGLALIELRLLKKRPPCAIFSAEVVQMNHKYVPLDKRTKREQKEYHATQRRDWGIISPVTRKVESAKVYNRKKSNKRWEYEPNVGFFGFIFS